MIWNDLSTTLDQKLTSSSRRRIALIGCHGSGKSLFIDSFFNEKRCRTYYENHKIIVYRIAFTTSQIKDISENTPAFFENAVLCAVEELKNRGETELYEKFVEDYHNAKNDFCPLITPLRILAAKDWKILLVVENFELFSTGENFKPNAHRYLDSLLKTESELSMMVVSAYSFAINNISKSAREHTNDQAQPMTGSYLSHLFYSDKLPMPRLEKDELTEFLKKCGIQTLNEQCIEKLREYFSITGGIPHLARTCYDILLEQNDISKEELCQKAAERKKDTINKWLLLNGESTKAFLCGGNYIRETVQTASQDNVISYFDFSVKYPFLLPEEHEYIQCRDNLQQDNIPYTCEIFQEYLRQNPPIPLYLQKLGFDEKRIKRIKENNYIWKAVQYYLMSYEISPEEMLSDEYKVYNAISAPRRNSANSRLLLGMNLSDAQEHLTLIERCEKQEEYSQSCRSQCKLIDDFLEMIVKSMFKICVSRWRNEKDITSIHRGTKLIWDSKNFSMGFYPKFISSQKQKIVSLLNLRYNNPEDPEAWVEKFADQLQNIITLRNMMHSNGNADPSDTFVYISEYEKRIKTIFGWSSAPDDFPCLLDNLLLFSGIDLLSENEYIGSGDQRSIRKI